jgi:hypothetical protein
MSVAGQTRLGRAEGRSGHVGYPPIAIDSCVAANFRDVPERPFRSLQLPVVGASMSRICGCPRLDPERLDEQVDLLGFHIPSLVGVAATFTSIYAAFARIDADQSDQNRKFVREWLLGIKIDHRYWAVFFKDLFARVFGDRHFSAKCIRRSALFSISLCAAILAYGYYFKVGKGVSLRGFAVWTMQTIVADYLSLWKTRILLTRSSLISNGLTAVIVVVGDAFATLVVTLAFAGIVPLIAHLLGANTRYALQNWITMAFIAFSWPHIGDSLAGARRLMWLVPLFTSAWLWVYLLVAYAMRAANYLPLWLRPLSKVMDFESHPVRTIGYVAAAVGALIVGIITLA